VVVNFLIMASAVFLLIKALNEAKKRIEKEQSAAGPPEVPADVKLLTEIRDLLKNR
jgi:large conductance mechanosensitive channel